MELGSRKEQDDVDTEHQEMINRGKIQIQPGGPDQQHYRKVPWTTRSNAKHYQQYHRKKYNEGLRVSYKEIQKFLRGARL